MELTRPAERLGAPSALREAGIVVLALLPAAALLWWANASWLPWIDEAQFVDPAARAHFGQGFTSTAWPYQAPDEFFAGNAPGYSLLLVPWFETFGFGLVQARSLNWVLALLAAGFLWRGLRRVAADVPAWVRGVALGAAFLGSGISLSLWSARYDMTGLAVASAIFMVATGPAGRRRDAGLLLGGVLLFYAGFHLVVGAVVMVAALMLLEGLRPWRRLAAMLGAGLAIGLVSWLAVLAAHGLVRKFGLMLFGSQHTLSGQLAQLVVQGDTGLYKKLAAPGQLLTQDPSLTLLALALVALLARAPLGAGRDADGWPRLRRLALVFVLVLPVALMVIGKFPVYYTWIAYVPAALLAAVAGARRARAGSRAALAGVLAVTAVASALGIGSRLRGAQVPPGSPLPAQFDAWVRQAVPEREWVYADFEAYFAARGVAEAVIVPTYGQTSLVKGIPERDRVNAAIVRADHAERVPALLGGRWEEAGRFDAAPALRYVALRRAR